MKSNNPSRILCVVATFGIAAKIQQKNTIGKFANRYYSLLYFFNKIPSLPMMRSKMVFLFVLLLASAISYILPHTFVDN